jgi:thioredoxin
MPQINSLINYVVAIGLIGVILYALAASQAPVGLPEDADFVSRVQRPGSVVVKFGADWCPPCRQIDRELEKFAQTYVGQATVIKIDIEKQPQLARHYRVRGIPHLVLFKEGQAVAQTKGFHSLEQLAAWAGVR